MADSPSIAQSSAQRGFVPPGPGLYRFSFDTQGLGLDQGYWDGPRPKEDQTLDDFLQQLVAGITQLPPSLVFPRWQDAGFGEEPNIPDAGIDWAGVGVVEEESDPGWAYYAHEGANDGRDDLSQHETVTLLCSFYGPNAGWYAGLLRDGIQIPQNREVLQLNGMGLVRAPHRTIIPEYIKGRWLRRVDYRVYIHREIRRQYPILNLLQAAVTVGISTPGDALLTRSLLIPKTP